VCEQVTQPFGDVDILVNGAANNIRPPLPELSTDQWDLTMALNLDTPYLLGQHFGPRMAARGWGRILNIASQQAFRAFGNSGGYGASKAGVVGLTRSQAEAWSRSGVCCNTVVPGFVHTPLTAQVNAERSAAYANRTMVGRNGEPTDFAGTAVFLAGRASDYVTGQAVYVDGGFAST
jgi:NAD(P)-dependent dehydrogenase (short-subunit alcohol dehydrogenase family)